MIFLTKLFHVISFNNNFILQPKAISIPLSVNETFPRLKEFQMKSTTRLLEYSVFAQVLQSIMIQICYNFEVLVHKNQYSLLIFPDVILTDYLNFFCICWPYSFDDSVFPLLLKLFFQIVIDIYLHSLLKCIKTTLKRC